MNQHTNDKAMKINNAKRQLSGGHRDFFPCYELIYRHKNWGQRRTRTIVWLWSYLYYFTPRRKSTSSNHQNQRNSNGRCVRNFLRAHTPGLFHSFNFKLTFNVDISQYVQVSRIWPLWLPLNFNSIEIDNSSANATTRATRPTYNNTCTFCFF